MCRHSQHPLLRQLPQRCIIFCASLRKRDGLQDDLTGCRTGNGEKLSSSQAEPGQAIKSAVAYFPSISCATSSQVALYAVAARTRTMQCIFHRRVALRMRSGGETSSEEWEFLRLAVGL